MNKFKILIIKKLSNEKKKEKKKSKMEDMHIDIDTPKDFNEYCDPFSQMIYYYYY